ncbi:MAG: hypothetical protein KKH11_03735 [Candidatus Omnitrophica bacterium]|nr:hypothetical protein [Candidatus Omnitrophota bacterium]MBU4141129.1 hypothetical protein [Candidatus Omnitrophota bacterium]
MSRKHKCQICGREIDDAVGLAHVKAEEYLIELIRRDHPEWNKDMGTCDLCLEYYRELIKRTEI